MTRSFNPIHLGAWVLVYAACAAAPWWVIAQLPGEYLARPVRSGVTVGDAAGWFPRAMATAAGVTLAVGLAFGAVYAVLEAAGWVAARTAGSGPIDRGWAWRAVWPARAACGSVGVALIGGGIVGIWLVIAGEQPVGRVDLFVAAIGGGIGVATGGVHHSRD